MTAKIAPCLWFDGRAEEAAALYTSLFPDSRIDSVWRQPDGSALLVEFTLAGQRVQGLNGGPGFPHTNAMSLSIDCADQAEVDRYWDGLLAGGGTPLECGWLKDRFGVPWQIVPAAMTRVMRGDDAAARERAFAAMMKMTKFDVAAIEAAAAG